MDNSMALGKYSIVIMDNSMKSMDKVISFMDNSMALGKYSIIIMDNSMALGKYSIIIMDNSMKTMDKVRNFSGVLHEVHGQGRKFPTGCLFDSHQPDDMSFSFMKGPFVQLHVGFGNIEI